ncbi:MAG TPA: SPW repeat protein [Steroidobacteraceae bacterium]|nr:SPW repeat protein [Steroidobacteraceae bacterium]
MATRDLTAQIRTASGINVALGIWLIISPWIYGYASSAPNPTSSSVIVGALILIFGAIRYNAPHTRTIFSWANIVLGAWTVFSPWIFSFVDRTGYVLNSVIVGIIVVALAIWSGSATVSEHRHQTA